MIVSNTFLQYFSDYTTRSVILGSAFLGIIAGTLGTFAVLRKQSLLGDAVSHAALPGIALAFIVTGEKNHLVFILGALIAGWLATVFFMGIIKTTRIKSDSALGIILSVFFGFGILLLTYIQKMQNAAQAGIEKFLFGQAAAIILSDIITMAVFGLFVLLILLLFWKEFKLMVFNPEFASAAGFNVNFLDIVLTGLIVISIVIGLQTVGVILMSSMLVSPATAARQWTEKLGVMALLGAVFGALAGIIGAMVSAGFEKIPTGPVIIIVISVIVIISLFFAPNRGILWVYLKRVKQSRKIRTEAVLLDLYELSKQHQNGYHHSHDIKTISIMTQNINSVQRTLKALATTGLAEENPKGKWRLTPEGFQSVENLVKNIQKL